MTKNFEFELVNDPEVIRYTHLQNSSQWKSKLSAEQYADREWHIGCESKLGKRREADNLGLFHFVLRDKSIQTNDKVGDIVAACETMNRKAWRIDPNGELKEVIAPCVGGVFTNENYRGRGYAHVMITKLNEFWDARLDNDGFIFLYSEVGDYYQRFGYNSDEVKLHEIAKLENHEVQEIVSSEYHFLKYEEYTKIVELQYQKVKNHLIAKSKTQDKTLYSLIPSIDIYSWFHDRDIFIASKLKPDEKIEHFGVSLNDGSYDSIVWLHDWNDGHLTIISVSSSSSNSFKKLIDLAIQEAQRYHLHGIHMWHSALGDEQQSAENLKYLETFDGIKTFQENGSRSALRPLDGAESESYSWEYNDKWCWF
jgi:hypothetical protein